MVVLEGAGGRWSLLDESHGLVQPIPLWSAQSRSHETYHTLLSYARYPAPMRLIIRLRYLVALELKDKVCAFWPDQPRRYQHLSARTVRFAPTQSSA
eukprot:6193645-Prymnesium_polylepis.2